MRCRGVVAVGMVVAAGLGSCDSPRLRRFLSGGVPIEQTFGQLHPGGGTPRVAHHVVIDLPIVLPSPASGTVEFIADQDGLANCLILRPRKHLTTPNNFSGLVALPKPGAVAFALCNLDATSVEAQMATRYDALLGAGQGALAAVQFIAHAPSFQRVDVMAHETDPLQSTPLGSATGGKLHLAAFTRKDEVTTYVNPVPYLAAVFPALELDATPPIIDEVLIQTSDAADFAAPDNHSTAPLPAPGPGIGRRWMRIVVRVSDRVSTTGPLLAPYRLGYVVERLTLSGATVSSRSAVSRGDALLNTQANASAEDLAGKLYGDAPPTVSAPTGPLWLRVPWDPTFPPAAEARPSNALDAARAFAVDLHATATDGSPVFGLGAYEATISVSDGINPAVTQSFRFEVTAGPTPPGDGEISYTPSSGPIGTEVVFASATADAFEEGRTTVTFNGTFDPDGDSLAATPSFTIAYPASTVRVIDGAHAAVRIGAVKPAVSIAEASTMRFGRTGRLTGSVAFHTDRTSGTPYDHALATAAFGVSKATSFGVLVDGELVPIDSFPVSSATTGAQVAATPDFEQVVVEQRLATDGAPPATITARIRTLDATGDFADNQPLEMTHTGEVGGLAVYRSVRRVVFLETDAASGPHGSGLLGVHLPVDGKVRLDGDPP